jgi:hypothetical protein
MRLALRSGVQSILDTFDQTPDRREAHGKLQPLLQELCANPQFVFDAFRHFLATPDALSHRRLTLPLFESGDISVALHIFAPLRDGAHNIACDNLHHHGWRVLTSGVICGGYHFIDFIRRSHEARDGEAVLLQIDRISDHTEGRVRRVDSHTPHVVFRPESLCCTLAFGALTAHCLVRQ